MTSAGWPTSGCDGWPPAGVPPQPGRGGRGRAATAGHRLGCVVTSGGERRAARLLRWYPPTWRARYGDEFAELLLAEVAELRMALCRAGAGARGGPRAR